MPTDVINFIRADFSTDVSEEPSLKFHIFERIVATEIFRLYSRKSKRWRMGFNFENLRVTEETPIVVSACEQIATQQKSTTTIRILHQVRQSLMRAYRGYERVRIVQPVRTVQPSEIIVPSQPNGWYINAKIGPWESYEYPRREPGERYLTVSND